jgi:hypothetical protein
MFLCLLPEGYGAFYRLGSTGQVGPTLEMVGSWRSVVDFYIVRVSSRVFYLPLGCYLRLPGIPGDEVDDA